LKTLACKKSVSFCVISSIQNSVWVVNSFQASFSLCGAMPALVSSSCTSCLANPCKSLLVLFVCLFLQCGKQRELELLSIMNNKPSQAKPSKAKQSKGTRGVSHCGLAIKYLKAKEELWKLKYFTMQEYNLQKIL